jgi:hypothetical protein
MKFRSESGTAILEFVAFVLVAQLFVLGISLQLAQTLTQKVRLQILASAEAKAEAGNKSIEPPEGIRESHLECDASLLCLALSQGTTRVVGLSLR